MSQYLLNEVANNCFAIATDKSGCCVLQQCVNYAKGEMKDHLMSVIVHNVLDLADDCYGFVSAEASFPHIRNQYLTMLISLQ